VPLNVGDLSPVSVPTALGGTVLAAEPLRHGQANAATGGISPRPVLLPPGPFGRRAIARLTPLVTLIADSAGWS
jgi:hypothetical protein